MARVLSSRELGNSGHRPDFPQELDYYLGFTLECGIKWENLILMHYMKITITSLTIMIRKTIPQSTPKTLRQFIIKHVENSVSYLWICLENDKISTEEE